MLVEHFDIFKSYLKQAELVFSDIYISVDINCCNLFNPGDSHIKCLINILDVYQLTQVITEPTRITSSTSTLINLFINNNEESIVHSSVYFLPFLWYEKVVFPGKIPDVLRQGILHIFIFHIIKQGD